MTAVGTSTGSDARCATPATAERGGGSGESLTRPRLSPQQQAILDALRCMEWCEIPDLMEAAGIQSEATLKGIISKIRKKRGHRIWCKRGWKSRGRVGAYSLRGKP